MGVGVVTVPSALLHNDHFKQKISSIADFVINLTAFDSQVDIFMILFCKYIALTGIPS